MLAIGDSHLEGHDDSWLIVSMEGNAQCSCLLDSIPLWSSEARYLAHLAPWVLSYRDVGHCGGHLTGALETAVAGEWHLVLPRVPEQLWAVGPGNRPHTPGAIGDCRGADAHSSHFCDGE